MRVGGGACESEESFYLCISHEEHAADVFESCFDIESSQVDFEISHRVSLPDGNLERFQASDESGQSSQ